MLRNPIDFNHPYFPSCRFPIIPIFSRIQQYQSDLSCDLQIQLSYPGQDS